MVQTYRNLQNVGICFGGKRTFVASVLSISLKN